MGAGSERSVRQVAERGYNMLLGQHDLAEDVLRHVAQFKADVTARGRLYDPMHVGVARAVHFADTADELEAAYVRRYQGHLRINKLAERPGYQRERFARHDETEIRQLCDDTAIFGTPTRSRASEALRRGGVEYVIVHSPAARRQHPPLRRDIMPAFADQPRSPKPRSRGVTSCG